MPPKTLNVSIQDVLSSLRTYLLGSGGNKITSTTIGAKEHLDVTGTGTVTGSVSVTNGAGAAAVNVQDGGNSLSVDGTVAVSSLPAITGTVTANAGTNLNTSALALESGHLAGIEGDTSSIDGKITACNTGAIAGTVAVSNITACNTGAVAGTVAVSNITACNTGAVAGTVAVTTVKPDGTNTQPSMDTVARAGFQKVTDGTDTLAVDTNGRINIIEGNNKAWSDTSFVTGDSPVTLDVNAGLGRNGNAGFIANDGPGNISVQTSWNGTDWGDAFVLKAGEVFPIDGLSVDSIKLTWVADSAYRVVTY